MTIKYLDSKRLSGSPISDIVHDTTTSSESSGSVSSLTHTMTVADNSNRVLIACVSSYGSAPTHTGVTWNGDAMTAVPNSESYQAGSNNRTQLYYIIAPDTGSHNIVASFSGSATCGIGGMSFYNVNQTTPVGAANTSSATSTATSSLALTPTVTGSWIIAMISSSSSLGSATGLTQSYTEGTNALLRGGRNESPTIGSANTVGWGTSNHSHSMSGCAIIPFGDTKPTNAQVGSRYEETDTTKIYHEVASTLSKTNCVGYYTLDETSGNPTNHVTTGNGFTDIPTQTIYYLAHGHDQTGRHFVKKVGSSVTTISESDWINLKGALTEMHTSGSVAALPSGWSGMWQGSTSSINGHGWYAISFSTDTNSPVNGSTGATQNITGKHGTCFQFSGGNNEQVGLNGAMIADYYYPTQHASTTHQADFAISCWINITSDNTGYPSVISNYGGGNTAGFQFLLYGANTISFHTSTSAIHGSTVMSSGTWYHVVATRESGYLKLYVNGSADGTPVANAHVIQATLDTVIGGKADGTAGFNGKIDDVSIWRRALTEAEALSLYVSGTLLTNAGIKVWTEEGT